MKSKLVRDKIPEIKRAEGESPRTHIASQEEYKKRLREKLSEEVDEFLSEENVEEYVDMLEVLEAIKNAYQFDNSEITKTRKEKAEKKGTFSKRIVLDN
jgi:predicted house-cleaning noncanonical NTP pyrophosphatase (MazG superfamily)